MRRISQITPAALLVCKRLASVQSLGAFGWPLLFVALANLLPGTAQASCLISCKTSLSISLGFDGQATLSAGILLQDPTCDPADFRVEITDGNGNNYGNTIDCSMLGLHLTASVIHNTSGNFCRSTIIVSDYLAPVINCVDTTVLCIDSTLPEDIGFPTLSDNCSSLDSSNLSYSDVFADLACFTNHAGDSITAMIERTWQATDEQGNMANCVQHIYLKRATISDVVFPAHRNGFTNPALNCSQDPTDLSLTGEPTINGRPITNGGHCELVVSFSDQIVPDCSPAAFKILRTWTVIDWCSDEFTLNVQIIKVEDRTAPTITCPADLTVGTHLFSCDATVTLPTASATDDCSDLIITPTWAFGSGYGPFNNIPLGTHTVTYTATDACGNSSDCTMQVTVIDDVAPVTVCDIQTQVDLTTQGYAEVFALTFDDGSHDNCTLGEMVVSLDGINYGPSVRFGCEDVGMGFLPVWLRVYDLAGNYNECQVGIEVIDRFRPSIYCPSAVNIECSDDVNDLTITGSPLVDDNCAVDTVFYTDQENLNSCNVGTISRRWTVRDAYGNESYCTQLITLEDHTEVGVTFPPDFSTTECGAATDPSLTGEPVVSNAQCESIWINHTDEVFDLAGPACKKIFRTWTVINWCTYDPNSGTNEGRWEHIQLITIIDEQAPVISCPADTVVHSFSSDCNSTLVQLPLAEASDCSSNLSITNNSFYATANGADASGNYPIGTHTITFTAADGCGNTSSCSMILIIEDHKPPQPYCKAGISVSLNLEGTITITPETLNNGSTDNCTDSADLIYEVSPSVFTCDDLGQQTVEFIVRDEAGNSASCQVSVLVQDGVGACGQSSIGGLILTETGREIVEVDMQLSGTAEDSVKTGLDGYYNFEGLAQGAYVVTPTKNSNHDNGVTTFDVILMRRHILNVSRFNSPYKIIAADINRSGSVTTFDIVEVQRVILQIASTFRSNTAWRFVRADHVFDDPADPFASPFPEVYSIDQLGGDILDADFIGVKIGDLNGNADPASLDSEGEERNLGPSLELLIADQQLEAGQLYTVGVGAATFEQMLGWQLAMDWEDQSLEMLQIRPTESGRRLGLKEEDFVIGDDGILRASWAQALPMDLAESGELFELEFVAKTDGKLSDLLYINQHTLDARTYWQDDDHELGIAAGNLWLKFTEKVSSPLETSLSQNYPNPVRQYTRIAFDLPEEQTITLRLFDLNGREVGKIVEGKYTAGRHEVSIDIGRWQLTSGLYHYHLETSSGFSAVRTMMVE
ncbi:MAG: HYR domain-containing protein [Bacteroidota bacterium]